MSKTIKISTKNKDEYKRQLYQAKHDSRQGESIKDINKRIKKNQHYWNHPSYANQKLQQIEKDKYIENPCEVEEGVVECPKCKSNKTYSVSKMLRAADEPMSTISLCLQCGKRWTE